jgi:GT2 family glycosyltransferase
MTSNNVTIVTVTYGDRWKFLSQVLDSVINDDLVSRIIIVDNASRNRDDLVRIQELHKNKVEVIANEKNMGSAGGFAQGLERARTIDCQFVLMLDDDNVLEKDGVSMLLERHFYLNGKRVVSCMRPDILDSVFFRNPPHYQVLKKTLFDVWNFGKIRNLFFKVMHQNLSSTDPYYYPIVPVQGFAYGGTLLPIEAVREASLPDRGLVLYGDDVEYSWGVLDKGYTLYLSERPAIRDVDLSFEEGDHIAGLFNPTSSVFKVYFRIRNMVLISKRNTTQSSFALASSIVVWVGVLFLIGLLRYGPTKGVLQRILLIVQAAFHGYNGNMQVPSKVTLP